MQFFLAPQLAGVDEGADVVIVPQHRLGFGAVEATVSTEIRATLGQLRALRMAAASGFTGYCIYFAEGNQHAWISSRRPLSRLNVHSRCNLGARYRCGIEGAFLVEEHQGYAYEHTQRSGTR